MKPFKPTSPYPRGLGIALVLASIISWTPLAANYTRFLLVTESSRRSRAIV